MALLSTAAAQIIRCHSVVSVRQRTLRESGRELRSQAEQARRQVSRQIHDRPLTAVALVVLAGGHGQCARGLVLFHLLGLLDFFVAVLFMQRGGS